MGFEVGNYYHISLLHSYLQLNVTTFFWCNCKTTVLKVLHLLRMGIKVVKLGLMESAQLAIKVEIVRLVVTRGTSKAVQVTENKKMKRMFYIYKVVNTK